MSQSIEIPKKNALPWWHTFQWGIFVNFTENLISKKGHCHCGWIQPYGSKARLRIPSVPRSGHKCIICGHLIKSPLWMWSKPQKQHRAACSEAKQRRGIFATDFHYIVCYKLWKTEYALARPVSIYLMIWKQCQCSMSHKIMYNELNKNWITTNSLYYRWNHIHIYDKLCPPSALPRWKLHVNKVKYRSEYWISKTYHISLDPLRSNLR